MTIPLVQQTDKGNEGQAANIPPYDGLCDCLALCAFFAKYKHDSVLAELGGQLSIRVCILLLVNRHKPTDDQ